MLKVVNTTHLSRWVMGVLASIFISLSVFAQSTFAAVLQYDVPDSYDLTQLEYSATSGSFASYESAGSGVSFNHDGTKMYIIGYGNKVVVEYELSAPFDLSTATHLATTNGFNQDILPGGIEFNNDGTKLYTLSFIDSEINEFTLSTPFDSTTRSFVGSTSIIANVTNPTSMVFNDDGTNLVVADFNGFLYQYSLGTAYDLSTLSYTEALTIPSGSTYLYGVEFGDSGDFLYFGSNESESIYQYTLPTAYSVNGATHLASFNANPTVGNVVGFTMNPSGSRFYILDQSNDVIVEYKIHGYYNEAVANDGTIDNSDPLVFTITGDTFSNLGSGQLVVGSQVTVNNVPAGLTPVFTINSSSQVTLTFTGTASAHQNGNDISQLTFTFDDTAFTGGDASVVINSGDGGTHSPNVGIDFTNNPDTTAPADPTVTSHVNDDVVSESLYINGACETDATVYITSDYLLSDPAVGTCVSGEYSILVQFPASQGEVELEIYQEDAASNASGSIFLTLAVDGDGDGNAGTYENDGFNGGDGNGDEIRDSEQQEVSGALNPATGEYTTLEVFGDCEFITENEFLEEGSLVAGDPSFEYPVGLVDFEVECDDPGDSTDVTIYYSQLYDTSTWQYRKYDSLGSAYSDISGLVTYDTYTYSFGPQTGNTVTTVTFTVTDGDPATDEDGVADGFINDPSGPATPVSSGGGGGGGGSSTRSSCKDPAATNYSPIGKSNSDLCKYAANVEPTPVTTQTITAADSVCAPYLTKNIRLGVTNDSAEVKKLQQFLNDKQGENLTVDGVYSTEDYEAVKRFQNKYAPQVLEVWGLEKATGYVFITTRNQINSFYCNKDIECPYFTEYNNATENSTSNEVLKTKILMTELGFYNGTLTETWSADLKSAVKKFQETFSATMLKPWGMTYGSGYKYKTTNRYLNKLVGCDLPPERLENGTTISY